jgi:hypothetical protein
VRSRGRGKKQQTQYANGKSGNVAKLRITLRGKRAMYGSEIVLK